MTEAEYLEAIKDIRNVPMDKLIDLKIFEDEHNAKINQMKQEKDSFKLDRIEAKLDEIIRRLSLLEGGK